jgi:nicotinate-nucleotide pyrophosphorylase (carboxylating)
MITIPTRILLEYLKEDCPLGDRTSEALLSGREVCTATIIAKGKGVIAGLEEASVLFRELGITTELRAEDGTMVSAGQVLLHLHGNARAILLCERTALNIIGRMSAIATKTSACCAIVAEHSADIKIAGTRKTAPGCRLIDKKAVLLGGGDTHRLTLSDAILIKDNHRMLCSVEEAVFRAKETSRYVIVEAEADIPEEALQAAQAGADIILLDNMDPPTIAETTGMLREQGLRNSVVLEVSGGIEPKNLRELAKLDIDIISMGSLTHTVTNFDVSLVIQPPETNK